MYYFAYGSNLNKEQMSRRCPDAKPVSKMILPHARLIFRGVADIEYDEVAEVQGGLWKVTKDCVTALDRYEGVRSGLYRKVYLKVSLPENGKPKVRKVLVYVMNADHYRMPHAFYLGAIRKGYRDFGLDTAALDAAVDATASEIEGSAIFADYDYATA